MEDQSDILAKLNIFRTSYSNDSEIIALIEKCDTNSPKLQEEYQKIVNRVYEKYLNEIALNNYNLCKTLNGEMTSNNPTENEMLNYFKEVLTTKLTISEMKNTFEQLFKLKDLTDEQTIKIKDMLANVNTEENKNFGDTKLYLYIENLKKK